MPADTTVTTRPAPLGWKWRSSVWFVTLVVGFGQACDMLVYAIAIPVVPFRLQQLGYDEVSSKTGWLLFSFRLATPPVSYLSERYHARRWPLILGLVALIASQALFMEATKLWMMILARALQGISSTVVWVVALALLCDSVPEDKIGQQLGFAMSGYSFGLIIATPIGGVLYGQLGYRAPFIFGMIVAFVDLVGRLLVIEKADADKYRAAVAPETAATLQQEVAGEKKEEAAPDHVADSDGAAEVVAPDHNVPEANVLPVTLSPIQIIRKLGFSRRPLVVLFLTVTWGMFYAGIEPTLPLRAQAVWHLSVTKVGILFLAATAPSLFSGPIAGYLSDRTHPGLISCICVAFSLPWMYPLALSGPLAVFAVSLVFSMFFASGVIVPITAELAAVSRAIPGLGYAHVYGLFNLAYAVGSTVGPVVGGQIYDHADNGWIVLMAVLAALLGLSLILSAYMGDPFVASRQFWRQRPIWRKPADAAIA
ncbi:MFS general substrate transporter [Exidia glandulosa HHB12029]|uniref:MFS general substrate transporter n=1 Tax=Exidia glandulosa HHB12029 TaxID=1314781 RepID=A0A165PGR1_EXIGL|nr:MFS general substrate transporter [Exidia glandulosa HHB12029]